MALRQDNRIGADLELFTSGIPALRRKSRGRHSPPWTLGFGPAGGTRPIWGLYRFDRGERVVYERELFWQSCPSEVEVFRWCSAITGPQIAARLVESVGAFDDFYANYFAARPDFVECQQWRSETELTARNAALTILAPTAGSVAHSRDDHRQQIAALASSP